MPAVLPSGPRPSLDTAALRRAFQASGMTQGELARRAGVSPTTVSQAVAGAIVGTGTAARLAVALGIEPEALIRIQ